jgi:putative Ca2+/H+ antiporter (TMEM165/GDT1 family)
VKKEEAEDRVPDGSATSPRKVFAQAFSMVFMAEWGDATQIGSATLVAELQQPMLVFAGAMLGLWASAAVAVIVGRGLGRKIPARVLRIAAGILFCGFAVYTIIER